LLVMVCLYLVSHSVIGSFVTCHYY